MIDDHDAQIFARRLMNHFIAALQKKLLIPQRQMRGFARYFERALDHNGALTNRRFGTLRGGPTPSRGLYRATFTLIAATPHANLRFPPLDGEG
jgi:hypothetical protein